MGRLKFTTHYSDSSSRSRQPGRRRIESAQDRSSRYIEAKELSYFSNEDIRVVQRALNEMTTCRELFDAWSTRLGESRSGKQSKLEGDIRSQISGLQDDAEGALLQTHLIAKALQSFSRIMVRRLHSADVDGALEPAPEIQQIARQIQEHSAEVSHHVGRMCEKLTELVGTLDTVRRGDKSLKERIWRWLKRIFQVLATLFAVGAAVATPFNPLFGVLLGIGSVISSAASVMSSTMSEKVSNREFNEILKFLRDTIPKEADKVQESLQTFNACQEAIRLELELAAGNLVKLRPAAARRAQNFWDAQDSMLQLVQFPRP